MKKLIGFLGAAGLLLPSTAIAGGMTTSVGSDAMRVTGSSTSLSRVSVDTNLTKHATVGIAGANWGHSVDASAENLSYGSRNMHYNNGRSSNQAAGNVAADIQGGGAGTTTTEFSDSYSENSGEFSGGVIAGDVNHTEKNTPGQEAHPGKRCGSYGCVVEPTEATPETSSTNTSGWVGAAGGGASHESGESEWKETTTTRGGGSLHGAATANGTTDGAYSTATGHSDEQFVDGAGTFSYDAYTNGYTGLLYESGHTKTNIRAITSDSSSKRGFSTSSFSDTSWQ